MSKKFDVFMAHSNKDKPLIRQIYWRLKERGILPWLDEEEIPPGTRFIEEIRQAIGQIKTAAIFIGQEGLGPWQALELETFISQCVERGIPVIPVLLPNVKEIPKNLIFLKTFNAVLFQTSIDDERALFRLEWGITGIKPNNRKMKPKEVEQLPEREKGEKEVEVSPLFQKLEQYLKNGQWREADEETSRLMVQIGDKDDKGCLDSVDCKNFPREELRTIDQLWLKYSNNHFGLSVQKEIYLREGGKLDDYDWDAYEKMSEVIGWRQGGEWLDYDHYTFNTNAPRGHLPSLMSFRESGVSGSDLFSLL